MKKSKACSVTKNPTSANRSMNTPLKVQKVASAPNKSLNKAVTVKPSKR